MKTAEEIVARLEELRGITADRTDYTEWESMKGAAVDDAKRILPRLCDLADVFCYPTPDGDVQAEFEIAYGRRAWLCAVVFDGTTAKLSANYISENIPSSFTDNDVEITVTARYHRAAEILRECVEEMT